MPKEMGGKYAQQIIPATTFLAASLLLYGIPHLPAHYTGTNYIALHSILTIVMIWIWQGQRLSPALLIITAIIARVILIPAPLLTSNDAERYLWDGAVTLSGFDPYTTTPNHAEVTHLRSIWPTPPEHAKYPTIYPPGAILLFSLSAMAGPAKGILVWKSLTGFAGILSLFAMRTLLTRKNLTQHFPLFALSPLLILETGVGAHLDIFIVLTIITSLLFIDKHRYASAGIALAIGTSIKFLPLILLGPLFFFIRPFKNKVFLALATFGMIILIYALALMLGYKPIGTLPIFFEKWRGGSPLYVILETTTPASLIIWVIGGIAICLFTIAAWLSWRAHLYTAVTLTLAVPLLLSPVVFPWYLCVLIPLLTLCPSALLLLWTSTVPLIYEVLNGWVSENIWHHATWPLYAIAAAWGIGTIVDITRMRLKHT